MKKFILSFWSFYFTGILLYACTKDKGRDPELAYRDKALLDSAKNQPIFTYYKNKDSVYAGNSASPHGSFKLKFNKTARNVLTDNGKLPVGTKFPDGSMIVKEVWRNNAVSLYSLMYKHNQQWLWAEIEPEGNVHYSVKKDPSVCTNCHSQTGHRDLVMSFYFY
jgi:hypothetical protein